MVASRRLGLTSTAVLASVAIVVSMVTMLGPVPGTASSHREAPLISADPQVDTTDVYAFRSPDRPNTITLVSAWIPFEEPAGGPNFYAFDDDAVYDLKVDNDGDARPDIIWRFDFKDHRRNGNTFLYNTGQVTAPRDPDLNFFQTYDLHRIQIRNSGGQVVTQVVDNATAAPSHVGEASMPDYENDLYEGVVEEFMNGHASAFAGQGDDPFYLDLRIFDLLYGADLSETGDDTLEGFNVNVLALQVPRAALALGRNVRANPVIGMWATAARPSTTVMGTDGAESLSGPLRQVSRLGMPLVNEAVVPLEDKDLWNASAPKDDGQFLEYVTEPEVPKLVEAIYGIPAPDTPRNDLVEIFLTGLCEDCGPIEVDLNSQLLNAGVDPDDFRASEELRLNLTTPVCEPMSCAEYSRLGVIDGDVAGFPNGRRLGDDVIDIALTVLEDTALGDGVDENDVAFRESFPYVGLPTTGSDESPH
jgi:hypothetical protein